VFPTCSSITDQSYCSTGFLCRASLVVQRLHRMLASQESYGIRDLVVNEVQLNNDSDLIDFVVGYASLFSRPEYRFDSVTVSLEKQSTANQAKILGLEVGDICKIAFTPNGIAPQIVRYVEVREINHSILTDSHTVELGFDETRYAPIDS
jgi:hypothetical protein